MTETFDPYPLAADQQGVFVTAALVTAIGFGPAITYSQLRWMCERSSYVERQDGWTKVVATQIAADTGVPVKTVRKHLADFAERGWAERRQDLGGPFDRGSWWRLLTSHSGTSMSAKTGHQMSPKTGHVPSLESGKTTTSAEPKREHGAATPKTARARTPADDLFDALLAVDGVEPGTKLTRSQGSMYGKLRRELSEVGATPDDVQRRARRYRSLHPSWELTAAALVKHWGSLTPKRASAKPTRNRDAEAIYVGPTDFAKAVYGEDD